MADSPECVVAVDLGGTLTKIGYVGEDGTATAVRRLDTYRAGGADGLADWLGDRIAEAAAAAPGPCHGFGIAVPGIIDAASGTVRAAPNVGWTEMPIRDRLHDRTGLSGAVGHDVRAGGLAEGRLGCPDAQNVFFLPIGTGIAAAMIVDGRLLEAGGYAGEIGHTRVRAAGETPCACGQIGCLETVASAAGVARGYAAARGVEAGSNLDARAVAEAARAGDPDALAAFAVATDALTESLLLSTTLLGSEVIIIGGGLSGAADLFLPEVERRIAATATFQRVPEFRLATLGADAGLIGAGLLGWAELRGVDHD
ncbi:ROK family protein [Microlunatus parietis]|uniref:Glucokinase n=1 Tax=Microlunatus parietis TaxID=682979 RepID=A0A7Y9LEZ6_9ACTN|nr:ROK family protein [Microlunatus parietis]NYE73561.1 glucokinase [Microlunatus parietis]